MNGTCIINDFNEISVFVSRMSSHFKWWSKFPLPVLLKVSSWCNLQFLILVLSQFTIFPVMLGVVFRARRKIHYPRIIKVCCLNYLTPQWRLIFGMQPTWRSTGPVRDCGKIEEKLLVLAQIRLMHLQQHPCTSLPHIRLVCSVTAFISCCWRTES